MINLVYMNGDVFIWNADDWLTLRETHRITGNLVGTLGCLPRQDTFSGLPMMLMAEEARLLLDQKIARLLSFSSLTQMPGPDLRETFEQFREKSYREQVEYFQGERRKQISSMVDIIVEGKRRKLLGLCDKKKAKRRKLKQQSSTNTPASTEAPLLDRDSIVKQEMGKVQPITREQTLIQTATEHSWSRDAGTEVTFSFPNTQDDALRSCVFADLWSKGFYITSGHKFGGHFLVYPGDPIKFHAQYIVICKASHAALQVCELVTLGRLGTSVRKSVVLATLGTRGDDSGQIVYHTISWVP